VATYLVETPHPVEHAVEVLAGEQSSGTIEELHTMDTPGAPAFEEAWVSCDPDAVLGFFAVEAEICLRRRCSATMPLTKANGRHGTWCGSACWQTTTYASARRINRWWPPRRK
jgi:hypothetical protein